jgi:ribulose-5-phosphate 4-epimerase/fuculose-1-phosphate aldolase
MERPDNHEQIREGVIKFRLDFNRNSCVTEAMITAVNGWRQICFRLGLIGQTADRYEGFGFGNISCRSRDEQTGGFLVTATQTGGKPVLGPDDYCHVLECDIAANMIRAEGATKPSSEALTHGQIYDLDPGAGCVIHVHSPEIWEAADELELLQTGLEIAYGTPAMAEAVAALYTESNLTKIRLFSMAGHEDGIVCYGSTPEEAGLRLVSTLARAPDHHEHFGAA